MVFVHGFGCGQEMWRSVAPSFERDHRVILFDLPGSGRSDLSTFDPERHTSLDAYGDDLTGLMRELEVSDAVLVGHSVSAMIGALVQIKSPELVSRLVMVAPSARYLDDDGYVGGFSETDIGELLDLMDRNHLGWQAPLAEMVAGASQPDIKQELEESFCRARPEIAAQFADVTFRGDNRADLDRVSAPTLVLQSRDDVVAPLAAGEYVRDHIRGAQFVIVDTHGHCPHMSAPEQTVDAIRRFIGSVSA